MPRRPALLLAALFLGACTPPRSHRYMFVDRDVPPPAGVPGAATAEKSREDGSERKPVEECGRGTGRTAQGECVALSTADVGYVQRVLLPAGDFVMGHIPVEGYDARPARERPAVRWSGTPPRRAHVESFWIDLTEVTVAAYEACVAEGACRKAVCPDGLSLPRPAGLPEEQLSGLPQTCVAHADAEAFCRARAGRLPSEAEWEYAARGVDVRIYPWGNTLMDELPPGPVPVARTRLDNSYFGILGMGSNALEWVSDRYVAESALTPFLGGGFRQAQGPLARARADFERRLACGDPPGPGCEHDPGEPPRHVLKGSVAGARMAARERVPPHPPDEELEGWRTVAHGPSIGFRCAADPGPDDPRLTVPTAAPQVPLVVAQGGHEVFGGVAEAASRREAEQFCAQLRVDVGGMLRGRFRLPTGDEVRALAAVFKGPGPFWTADGSLAQVDPRDPASAWEDVAAAPDDALAVRCVRDR